MKRNGFVLLIVCFYCVLLSGCATTQEKYHEAIGKNSIRDLENFLRENPKTSFTDSALKKLEELYFQKAEQNNSIPEYENFLRLRARGYFTPSRRTVKPPPGIGTDEYAVKAKEAIARLKYEQEFAKAKKMNTKQSYGRFLLFHPTGPHTEEAKRELEKAHFENARREGTVRAYNAFLLKYPKGEHADAARKEIEQAAWKKAMADNTAAGYEMFMRKYPESQFADEAEKARRKVEIADWEAAKGTGTIKGYQHFLSLYPKSEFAEEGKRRFETLEWEQAKAAETPEAYYAFLKSHAGGEHAEKAREILDRKMKKFLDANVKKVSFSIHRKEEPFMGEMVFTANPFLTGNFGTKNRPARMKLVKPASVEMRRPAAGHSYVVMNVDVNVKEEFPCEIKLVTAEGKTVAPHVKQIGPFIIGMDTSRPTWSKMSTTVTSFKKGMSGKVSFMWIAADEDVKKGTVFFGGRRYPLSKYR